MPSGELSHPICASYSLASTIETSTRDQGHTGPALLRATHVAAQVPAASSWRDPGAGCSTGVSHGRLTRPRPVWGEASLPHDGHLDWRCIGHLFKAD